MDRAATSQKNSAKKEKETMKREDGENDSAQDERLDRNQRKKGGGRVRGRRVGLID